MITETDKAKMIITEGAKRGMTLPKFIDLQINDFKQSDTYEEMLDGSKYYKNEGDIKNKKRTYINQNDKSKGRLFIKKKAKYKASNS